jgi:hypothetical protein
MTTAIEINFLIFFFLFNWLLIDLLFCFLGSECPLARKALCLNRNHKEDNPDGDSQQYKECVGCGNHVATEGPDCHQADEPDNS